MDVCINLLFFAFLLLSTCLPPMQGLTDDVLMPKWYGAMMMGMVLATIYLALPQSSPKGRGEGKFYDVKRMESGLKVAAMLVLTYHLVYVWVVDIIMRGIPDMRFLYIKGVLDNPTGFALHTCVLVAMIGIHPQPLPSLPHRGKTERSGFHQTLTYIGKGSIWILTCQTLCTFQFYYMIILFQSSLLASQKACPTKYIHTIRMKNKPKI